MPMRYWRIAPTNPSPRDHFDRVWSFDLANNTIAISWAELGDVRSMKLPALQARATRMYPDATARGINRLCRAILDFHGQTMDGMGIGDVIVANRGRSVVVGIGTVAGNSFYDESLGSQRIGPKKDWIGSRFLPVIWESRREFRLPPHVMMGRTTLDRLPPERFALIRSYGGK